MYVFSSFLPDNKSLERGSHKLLEIIQSGKLEFTNQIIKLNYFKDNKITVFFDRKNLELKGWEIKDQYNNNINFSLNIVAKNDVFKKGTFIKRRKKTSPIL